MNKEYEKFHRDNPDIISNLLDSLEALLDKFEKGIVPGEPLKSDALYMLDVYRDAIEVFNKIETPTFQRNKATKCDFDEDKAYQELAGLKECISLLLRMSREKMIEVEDAAFKSDAGAVLIQGNYCDEVIMDGSGKHYYSLSDKAEKVLKSKNFIGKIKKDNVSAIVPSGLILTAEKWSNLYARRIEFLRNYYSKKREGEEYILFTLDESKEMVFGCELSDSLDVEYTFAGVFDEKIDEHIDQLKGIASSGRIDKISIIIDSKSMAKILEDEGINPKDTPHISIEQL